MSKKVVLMILDGWGCGDKTKADAIFNANTPFVDSLYSNHANAQLLTDGENVGLPNGQMGNSEVGHLNIGAGRIVYQDLVKINKACESNEIANNPAIMDAFNKVKSTGANLHFMGLVSEGGVHSSQAHLHKLCDLAKENDIENVYIHAFTDGRDCDPKSGLGYMENLENHLASSAGEVVSVIGRYYAMDRDKRWERVKLAYDLLLNGEGSITQNIVASMKDSYANDITDEFIKPVVKTDKEGNAIGRIKDNDVVICFNFRTDRCREITEALTQQDFLEFNMHTLPLHYVTMTNYNNTYKNVNVAFSKDNLKRTLGEVLQTAGKTQIRIAETEKYPHVTFFFSGGREQEFKGEKRLMANSPKVATYDLQPEMSAPEITSAICAELNKGETDFVCLNFANPDMVGHTGDYNAIIKALETVDGCAKKVIETGLNNDYSFIVIADHGNADFVINKDGSPNTAHSLNPVPCIIIDKDVKKVNNGVLADVAPTILNLMQIEAPKEMTGKSLISE
jgi:2,3-bisphosphoglycerate-independent phosphoglycerate mutase